jgi:hypothetical protein
LSFDPIHDRAFAAPKGGMLVFALLLACSVPSVALRGQEAATYKQIVVTIVSRALDKARPEILSDTSHGIREQILLVAASDSSLNTDRSLGRKQAQGATVARESFVYSRTNRVAAHVVVVSGSVMEAGIKRTAYGAGVGDSAADAEARAVAHLRSRLPGWSESASPRQRIEHMELPPRSAPASVEQKIKRRALVYIAWNYVPEVGPSAQTDLGYAVAFNEDSQVASARPDAGWNVYPEIDDDEMRQRNHAVLRKLGAYKDIRSVSADFPLGSGMAVVIISARVPTAKGPVLQVYGAGIANDYPEALGKALKHLAGRSWGWSQDKHGYKEEYRWEIAPAESDSSGFLRIKPKLGSFGVRG